MKVREFQYLMKKLYFDKDNKRGIKNTFIWLVEEIGELAELLKKEEINTKKVSEELADIIAWTNSLANLLNINLEEALYNKYPNRCSKCNSIPCECEK